MEDKFTLLEELAQVGGLVFVGSCAMYLQGFVSDFNDIDLLVTSTTRLEGYFEVLEIQERVFKFEDRSRAFINKYGIGVDVFILQSLSDVETISIEDKECCTLQDQINFYEKIRHYRVIPNELKQKFNAQLNYLNTI